MMIWDCFPYWREIELAEARVSLWRGHDITHVAFLGDRTHRGHAIELGPLPGEVKGVFVCLDADGDWGREHQQRDAVWQLRDRMAPDDLVLLCDADEIVDPDALDRILAATSNGPVSLGMALYYYGTEWRSPAPWLHAKAFRARNLSRRASANLRLNFGYPVVSNAGWHLAWQGDERWIDEKLSAFAHAEFDTDAQREQIALARRAGIDPHGETLIHVPLTGRIMQVLP